MRTSLIPGLLEIASRNNARRNTDLLLFEIGNIYLPMELPLKELPEEVMKIAGIAQGGNKRHWLVPPTNYDFFYVKGILEGLAAESGVTLEYRRPTDPKLQSLLHPGRSTELLIKEQVLGFMGEIYPGLDEEWDLQKPVLFEIDLKTLVENADPTILAKYYPRFPAIQRDLAIVIPLETPANELKQRILALGGELLKEVEVFDVYQGQSIPSGHRSLALTMRYQSGDRTLTDEEVNNLNLHILTQIQQEFGAEWRK